MNFPRQRVNSSTVASIVYDPATAILEVEFVNGSIYQYHNVPAAIFEQFRTAPSKGRYVNARLRKTYACSRIA